MALKIAVCEDDQAQREALCALVARWAAAREHRAAVGPYPSAEAFLLDYAGARGFDILLLDVEMGAMNGVELARRLRRDKCRAEIIFLTSHTEFIGEGYEVDALHYLIKPVGAEKLFNQAGSGGRARGGLSAVDRLLSPRGRRSGCISARFAISRPSCTSA